MVTAADLPDVNLYYGHALADHPLIAVGKVRFAGEPIVGVVAEDAATADEALRLVELDLEPLRGRDHRGGGARRRRAR